MTHETRHPELKATVVALLEKNHHLLTKRDICKALGIKGARRIDLKWVLAELKSEGYGEKMARRVDPRADAKNAQNGRTKRGMMTASSVRMGLFERRGSAGMLSPCHRKDSFPTIRCDKEISDTLADDSIVLYHLDDGKKLHVDRVLGSIHDPKVYSLMAVHAYQLPHSFSNSSVQLAASGKVPPLGDRTDFRQIPLVTIDGEDARDFDDAVWAAPDLDPRNEGGWRLIVAIADVSHYVHPEDSLDREAYERGNSVYFPDRVIPMLPEALSNDLCSLRPDEDRACLAVEMLINAQGKIKSHHFKRGLMRSRARLTYNQVQHAIDVAKSGGEFDAVTGPLWDEILKPLYGAYQSFLKARTKRCTLDLNMPEHQVQFNELGAVKAVTLRAPLESHQLIEEMMIAANISAAKTLLVKKWPTLFRIHDAPDTVRTENLKTVLKSLKISIPNIKTFLPDHFNDILSKTKGLPHSRLINDLVLRCQSQAKYAPTNIGHFGLSLAHYCHFTSPIRRYADLVVHRSLIAALALGDEKHAEPVAIEILQEIGDHISSTERTASMAEREVMDRFMAGYLESQLGTTFTGAIVGVSGAGLFVALDQSGAQGFVPKSRLPDDYYVFDAIGHRYIGQRTRTTYQLGDSVTVLLEMADPITCSIAFSIVDEKRVGRISYKPKKGSAKLSRSSRA